MYVPDSFSDRKTEDIIYQPDDPKAIDQHKNTLPHLVTGKKYDSKRNIRHRCTYYGEHSTNTGDNKPKPGFIDTNQDVTDYCDDALKYCNHRDANGIAQH